MKGRRVDRELPARRTSNEARGRALAVAGVVVVADRRRIRAVPIGPGGVADPDHRVAAAAPDPAALGASDVDLGARLACGGLG